MLARRPAGSGDLLKPADRLCHGLVPNLPDATTWPPGLSHPEVGVSLAAKDAKPSVRADPETTHHNSTRIVNQIINKQTGVNWKQVAKKKKKGLLTRVFALLFKAGLHEGTNTVITLMF